jgi:hypothetical protein
MTTPPRATRRASTRSHANTTVPPLTEAQFQAQVIQLATLLRWRCYHTWTSLHSAAGYPDLTLVRGKRLVFAELKSERGKVRPEQEAWLHDLHEAGAQAFIWRPSEWARIVEILR